MAVSYYKDIYSYLTFLYPNRKVFVISDHHFFHRNIVDYERNKFTSVDDMNEFVIKKHNDIVTSDDIVIFLGDFCFKNSAIKEINNKLNGHKFLLLGNHDKDKLYLKHYKEYGFENVFMYPVKFNNAYLSHYPILGDHPDEVFYKLLENEFKKNKGYNMHGHEHNILNSYPDSINVSVEAQRYYPLCIGKTGENSLYNNVPFIISSNKFNELLSFLVNEKKMNEKFLITDFIYSMMISCTSEYSDKIFFNGSYTLYKKYGFPGSFSDLDASIIYDNEMSKKANYTCLKKCADSVFSFINYFEGFNLSFDKRMNNVNIIECIYTNTEGRMAQTYLDMNIILEDIYKESDFIKFTGSSVVGNMCFKYFPEINKEYLFPMYQAKFLNVNGDISNLVLQYLYQIGYPEKKRDILNKLNIIMKNISPEKYNDFIFLEDTLIRFLIRNILFFNSTRRTDEIKAIYDIKPDISCLNNNTLGTYLENILYDLSSEYNRVLSEISKAKLKDIGIVSKEIIKTRK